jgi:hypothetical protein
VLCVQRPHCSICLTCRCVSPSASLLQSASVRLPLQEAFVSLQSSRERLEAVQQRYVDLGVPDAGVVRIVDEAARSLVASEHLQVSVAAKHETGFGPGVTVTQEVASQFVAMVMETASLVERADVEVFNVGLDLCGVCIVLPRSGSV